MTSSPPPASEVRTATAVTTVSVYPLVPTRALDDPLTYSVPESLRGALTVGTLVGVPLGTARRLGIVVGLDVAAPDGVTTRPIHGIPDGLAAVPSQLVQLAEWIADTYGCARTRAMALIVPPRVAAHARAGEATAGRRVKVVRRRSAGNDVAVRLSARQVELRNGLGDEWERVVDAVGRLSTTRASLAALARAGVADITDMPADELARTTNGPGAAAVEPLTLTGEQAEALGACLDAPPEAPATLLVGATGTGKTEVYLQAIARVLADGLGAIVLVPEIALTPQTAGRFQQRFPGTVEVLHSNMTRAQRAAAHTRIARGASRVVVGPRSAIFAPVEQLGIVVVDEEHDSSYKQDSEPRYDARRVAYRLVQLCGARLIFGSATPRLESWHGVRRVARLRHRASGGRLAPVELVDLRQWGERFPLTDPVRAALDATLRRGRKAILLHNRRGYASAIHCCDCGHLVRCPNCDVALVVHGAAYASQRLDCHHCGAHAPIPGACPSCGSAGLGRLGAGTERLERDLREAFDVPILRLDADAARARGSIDAILSEFAVPGAAVLVGTQMVAKGHDFPDVELAVVVDADTALAVPDFRAEERAFALVAQLAGRAGRSPDTADTARVLVQSWNTGAEFLRFARTHDVDGFLSAELERRRRLDYPPFARLVRVVVSTPGEALAEDWAHTVADGLLRLEAGSVIGPARLLRIAGRHRAQVVVKTRNAPAVAAAMRRFLRATAGGRSRRDVRIALDVDPQTLL